MTHVTKEEALNYHIGGKIEIKVKTPCETSKDLSMAYTPGVAEPCKEINADTELAYKYTNKANLVAVITDGTAVLGLGDIGAIAGKPVMEGKAVLFKKFANVDAFDIELDEHDPDKIVEICKALDIKSTSTVHKDLSILAEQGFIKKDPSKVPDKDSEGNSNRYRFHVAAAVIIDGKKYVVDPYYHKSWLSISEQEDWYSCQYPRGTSTQPAHDKRGNLIGPPAMTSWKTRSGYTGTLSINEYAQGWLKNYDSVKRDNKKTKSKRI